MRVEWWLNMSFFLKAFYFSISAWIAYVDMGLPIDSDSNRLLLLNDIISAVRHVVSPEASLMARADSRRAQLGSHCVLARHRRALSVGCRPDEQKILAHREGRTRSLQITAPPIVRV